MNKIQKKSNETFVKKYEEGNLSTKMKQRM